MTLSLIACPISQYNAEMHLTKEQRDSWRRELLTPNDTEQAAKAIGQAIAKITVESVSRWEEEEVLFKVLNPASSQHAIR